MSLTRQTRTGVLHLHFGVRHGQTFLLRDLQKAPLMVVRPFRLPCGTLMVYIINPTGGVLGGDHSEIRVQVDAGARALLLTQSATRVQPSPDGAAATQDIRFTVAAGGRLEYYPERTIPFAGSRFHQTVRADLEGGAEFGWVETLAAGRVQAGESLRFAEYRSEGSIVVDGRRVYLDRQHFCPDEFSRAPGVLGDTNYWASGVWWGVEDKGFTVPSLAGAAGRNVSGALWLRLAERRGVELDRRVSHWLEAIGATAPRRVLELSRKME
ncbi:MAG: urease accessory protein UreD [Deinococcus sp.]|uniref:urease accessory protein UreD n=1 Tax=Deinococcus sp. TaxID=47478 RepID=UPI0026DBBE2A|nr:urease accessory protein UreD [Deinococcus sp.]MDO4244953.1 urease accessory protein UreD [Deinococcus sp.]